MKNLFALLSIAIIPVALANGQSKRTWVSSTGLDSNPCNRTSPCASFGGALSKTSPGGEINCVDANDYGPVIISGSLTIDCRGTLGSIRTEFVPISIHAGAGDVVTIRNLTIAGSSGIEYTSGKALHLESVHISADNNHSCVDIQPVFSSGPLLTIDDATLSGCADGISVFGGTGTTVANINNTRIFDTNVGANDDDGSRVTIRRSTIYVNALGVAQLAGGGNSHGSTVTLVNSTVGYSGTAALQSFSGEFILTFGSTFVNDVRVFDTSNGGTIFTGRDNNNSGSATGTANGGTVPKI